MQVMTLIGLILGWLVFITLTGWMIDLSQWVTRRLYRKFRPKRCPHCGGSGRLVLGPAFFHGENTHMKVAVRCGFCGGTGGKEQAISNASLRDLLTLAYESDGMEKCGLNLYDHGRLLRMIIQINIATQVNDAVDAVKLAMGEESDEEARARSLLDYGPVREAQSYYPREGLET